MSVCVYSPTRAARPLGVFTAPVVSSRLADKGGEKIKLLEHTAPEQEQQQQQRRERRLIARGKRGRTFLIEANERRGEWAVVRVRSGP